MNEVKYLNTKRKEDEMKKYILFDEGDLEKLTNGEKVSHVISGFGEVSFMSKEAFVNECNRDKRKEEKNG